MSVFARHFCVWHELLWCERDRVVGVQSHVEWCANSKVRLHEKRCETLTRFFFEESFGIGLSGHWCRRICCRLATRVVICRGIVSSRQSFVMRVVLQFAISTISRCQRWHCFSERVSSVRGATRAPLVSQTDHDRVLQFSSGLSRRDGRR